MVVYRIGLIVSLLAVINYAAAQDVGIQTSPNVNPNVDGLSEASKTPENNSSTPNIPELPEVTELSEDDLKLVAKFTKNDFQDSLKSLKAIQEILSNVKNVTELDEYEQTLYEKGKPLVENYLRTYEMKEYKSLTDKEKFILIAFMAGLAKVQQELVEWKLTHKNGDSIVANKAVGIDSESWEDSNFSDDDEDDEDVKWDDEGDEEEEDESDSNDSNFSDEDVKLPKPSPKASNHFRAKFPPPPQSARGFSKQFNSPQARHRNPY